MGKTITGIKSGIKGIEDGMSQMRKALDGISAGILGMQQGLRQLDTEIAAKQTELDEAVKTNAPPFVTGPLQGQLTGLKAGRDSLSAQLNDALLNSLRMGFQTLAIEQQSAEVWKVLAAVKTEFGKFGDVLVKVKRQLNTAANTIGETERRSRAMERKLRSVESLPEAEASEVLQLSEPLDFEVLSAADALAGDDDEVLA
jgi:predicted  nucleic acid-binding Zn-ribbon protein